MYKFVTHFLLKLNGTYIFFDEEGKLWFTAILFPKKIILFYYLDVRTLVLNLFCKILYYCHNVEDSIFIYICV